MLSQLSSRNQWIEFLRREPALCFIESPHCLVDFQSNHLQITLLATEQHRDATKYSLGARTTKEPALQLIKACHWQLPAIISGLEQLDFSSNVRDNSLLKAHTDLTVRKFYNKDRLLTAPRTLEKLLPLTTAPEIWCSSALARLLSNRQYYNLKAQPTTKPRPHSESLLLDIISNPIGWMGKLHQGRLFLLHNKQAQASLNIDLRPPSPKLERQQSLNL